MPFNYLALIFIALVFIALDIFCAGKTPAWFWRGLNEDEFLTTATVIFWSMTTVTALYCAWLVNALPRGWLELALTGRSGPIAGLDFALPAIILIGVVFLLAVGCQVNTPVMRMDSIPGHKSFSNVKDKVWRPLWVMVVYYTATTSALIALVILYNAVQGAGTPYMAFLFASTARVAVHGTMSTMLSTKARNVREGSLMDWPGVSLALLRNLRVYGIYYPLAMLVTLYMATGLHPAPTSALAVARVIEGQGACVVFLFSINNMIRQEVEGADSQDGRLIVLISAALHLLAASFKRIIQEVREAITKAHGLRKCIFFASCFYYVTLLFSTILVLGAPVLFTLGYGVHGMSPTVAWLWTVGSLIAQSIFTTVLYAVASGLKRPGRDQRTLLPLDAQFVLTVTTNLTVALGLGGYLSRLALELTATAAPMTVVARQARASILNGAVNVCNQALQSLVPWGLAILATSNINIMRREKR